MPATNTHMVEIYSTLTITNIYEEFNYFNNCPLQAMSDEILTSKDSLKELRLCCRNQNHLKIIMISYMINILHTYARSHTHTYARTHFDSL